MERTMLIRLERHRQDETARVSCTCVVGFGRLLTYFRSRLVSRFSKAYDHEHALLSMITLAGTPGNW